jgi:molecular chaperone HscB
MLKKYYALSKEFHPDNFSLQENNAQEKALDMSAKINEAKKILDNPYKRLEYILKEKGIIVTDEKYTLSPLFLGEMMDINEQLMELEFEPNPSALASVNSMMKEKENELFQGVKSFFDMEKLQASDDDFALLKDFYYKRKYIQRIAEKLR